MPLIETNSRRVIAVGDIHGCVNYLRLILESIDPQPDDTFIFLGDLVDRGPDSKGVIDEVIALGDKCTVHTIMGNHEEMVLGAFAGGPSDHKFWCKFGGIQALESFGVDHVQKIPGKYMRFIADCEDYIETQDAIFVHAGCNPNLPLDKTDGATLRWNSFPENPEPHMSGKPVFCGHSVQDTVLELGFITCIDTGAGVRLTGRLTAKDIMSGTIWQAGGRNKKATVKQGTPLSH